MSSSTSTKRKWTDENDTEEQQSRPMCQYGAGCYRKNPIHFQKFRHPPGFGRSDESPNKKSKQTSHGNLKINKEQESTVPFYVTSVRGILDQFNSKSMAISIKDILNSRNGQIISSVQFNYMFDIPWLMQQYPMECRDKPLLIVHGCTGGSKTDLEAEACNFDNIRLYQAKLPIAYGTHHSKMMFLLYKEGLRVVIHTANLIEQDWDQKTQGVWVSPLFAKMPEQDQPEDNEDKFKKDLLEYLDAYTTTKSLLSDWKETIRLHDMSKARARIVASVPGRHTSFSKCKWGHLRLRELLHQAGPASEDVDSSWPVIGQFSSIGSLGKDHRAWLCSEWLDSLASVKKKAGALQRKPELKLVFPTVENVRLSLEGYSAGGSLPYSLANAKKQPYLVDFLHQWKSSFIGRSKASPHIKTYARISPNSKEAAWFLVTSANLSKAAWGNLEKNNTQLMIRSYEIGVLFLPSYFVPNAKNFCISSQSADGSLTAQDGNAPTITFPYDLPLTTYGTQDRPWVWNARYQRPDSHDRLWMPSF